MSTPVSSSAGMIKLPPVSYQTPLHRALLTCGIATSLIWLGTDILASLRYAGYDYPLDPISSLSAVDSPVKTIIMPLSMIYIVFKICFAFGVWVSASQKRDLRIVAVLLFAFSLTDVASSFFPLNLNEPLGSFTNIMHSILAGGVNVILILLLIGFGARAGGKWFRIYSYATLLGMVVMGVLPLLSGFNLSFDQIPEGFGVGERINAYGYMLWMLVLSIVLLRHSPKIHSDHLVVS